MKIVLKKYDEKVRTETNWSRIQHKDMLLWKW